MQENLTTLVYRGLTFV